LYKVMIPLSLFKYRQKKLIIPELAKLVNLTVSLGFTSMALLGISWHRAMASEQTLQGEKTISQVNIVFVNPSFGDDKTGNGNERTPWKTITQALQVAQPNTVIMLSPGRYSLETGESFPLMLKQGVSIQGNPERKGQGIIIVGGGEYLSRSFGGQNVTLVGANQAGLSGVTVTNTNSRGYGLWIESTNPIVQDNTFTNNTQDGVSVTGNAAPTISKNYFYRNGANGITVTGNSQAQVRENIFQQTGFGINIAQNATPIVADNQIQYNRSGIIVQANARPTLRHNLIQGSQEDGLVVISQGIPDLGSPSQPGGNQFLNNARYDVNALAAKQKISAPGNNLAKNRIAGKVDLQGLTAPIARNPSPQLLTTRGAQQIPTGGEIIFSAPTISPMPATSNPLLPSAKINQIQPISGNSSRKLTRSQLPQLPANVRVSASSTEFPTPSSLSARTQLSPLPLLQADKPQLNYVQVNPNVVEFTAPQALQSRTIQRQPLPVVKRYATGAKSQVSLLSTRYRVVVQVTSDKEQELVRTLAPGAFSSIRQGRQIMQVGSFSSLTNAKEMIKILNSRGLKATVERLN
jgi:parallel beta-helix repeat protein